MAFATSQVKVESAGASWRTTGKWTGSVGDATGTLKVPGMRVLSAVFLNNLASGGPANPPSVSWSASNGVSTVTVQNSNAVSNGTFEIISA